MDTDVYRVELEIENIEKQKERLTQKVEKIYFLRLASL